MKLHPKGAKLEMTTKPRLFENGYYYHIYNRGIDKRRIFLCDRDYLRFLKTIKICNDKSTIRSFSLLENLPPKNKKYNVSVINYCLMPNHYHFTMKQLSDDGISQFLQRLGTSYTKYFNTKYKRSGRLFEYTYKAISIETDEQLLHLSRYIHLNPVLGGLVNNPIHYRWSSYNSYMDENENELCDKSVILSSFSSKESYKKFVLDHIDYAKSIKAIERQIIEKFEAAP